MLLEAIELIRALWTGNEITFDGDFYSTRKARLYTPPISDIPLYVLSLVPESASFAGMYGDGLMTVASDPEVTKSIVKYFELGAREAGKDPETMPRLIEVNVAYTDDKDTVIRSFSEYWAGAVVPAMFNQNIYTPKMSETNGAVVGKDILMKKLCVSGDPEDHVKFVQQYIDMGFTHIFFHCAGPDQRDFLVGYGKDVLPRIRKEATQTVAI